MGTWWAVSQKIISRELSRPKCLTVLAAFRVWAAQWLVATVRRGVVFGLACCSRFTARSAMRAVVWPAILMAVFDFSLSSCADRGPNVRVVELPDVPNASEVKRLSGSIQEVAPPAVLLDLAELMADVQPQVAITSPKSNQVINDTRLELKLRLIGLSIYKDEQYGLGPHLQIFLDDQPAKSVYALDEPIALDDLTPGSHTLRVVAVRPWGESFKNEAAYAQTTFHVFAKNDANTPDPGLPLLTYSEPQGTYGAEPVLLDFYLNNAPLHQLAQSSAHDDMADWRILCTVNGSSFEFDQWQPIYLKGLTPGQNWVQLSLIDEQGQAIDNVFNSAVRTFIYDSDQKSSLAQLLRGELSLRQVGQIALPGYEPPPETVSKPPVIVEQAEAATEDELVKDSLEPADISEEKEDLQEGAKPSSDDAFEVEDYSDSVDMIDPSTVKETTDFSSSAGSSDLAPAAETSSDEVGSDEVEIDEVEPSDFDDSQLFQEEIAPSAIEDDVEQAPVIDLLDDVTDELLPYRIDDAASDLDVQSVNESSSPATSGPDLSENEPLGAIAQLKKQLSDYWQILQAEKAESRSPELPSVLKESPAALENTPADINASVSGAEGAEELGEEPQVNFPELEKGVDLLREEGAIAPLDLSETTFMPTLEPLDIPESLKAPSSTAESVIVPNRPSDGASEIISDVD